MHDLPTPLVLVGAGNMGGAMLKGWLQKGLPGDAAVVLEPNPSPALTALCASAGIALNPPFADIQVPRAIVLAIKPQLLADVAPAIAALTAADTLVLSILAGKRLADLAAALPRARAIVRAMPNLPASVGRGITVAIANAATDERKQHAADNLLTAVGAVEWVDDESYIDAVTAVSGSGPAYVFHLVEAMAKAGVAAGLPEGLAARLARETLIGAAELLARSDESPAALREAVTSRGGTTAAGLSVLMRDQGLAALLVETVAAAARRSRELSA